MANCQLMETSMPYRLTCSRNNEEIHKLTLLRNGECRKRPGLSRNVLLLVVVTGFRLGPDGRNFGRGGKRLPPGTCALRGRCTRIPNFSGHEMQTAEKLASRLRTLGYEVTEHVGGNGIVALLKKWSRSNCNAAHRARCASRRGKDWFYLTPARSTQR